MTVSFYWSQFASKNYALSVQGFSNIIIQRSHSDSLQFNWNDFQSFVKQPMDFQSIVVEFGDINPAYAGFLLIQCFISLSSLVKTMRFQCAAINFRFLIL
jgi:hypothetical protein